MLPTEDDLARQKRRRAWWLFVARKVSGRTLDDVAKVLGLAAGSSVGDFERGVTEPSLRQLTVLAALYEVDLALFTDPPRTDEERLMRDAASGAATLEREDWEAEQGTTRRGGDELPGGLGRQSA